MQRLTREQWHDLSRLARMAAVERGQDVRLDDAVGALAEWRARTAPGPTPSVDPMRLRDQRERLAAHRRAMAAYVLTAAQAGVLAQLGPGWTVEILEDYDDWGVCNAAGDWWRQTSAWNGRVGTDSPSGEVYFYRRKGAPPHEA